VPSSSTTAIAIVNSRRRGRWPAFATPTMSSGDFISVNVGTSSEPSPSTSAGIMPSDTQRTPARSALGGIQPLAAKALHDAAREAECQAGATSRNSSGGAAAPGRTRRPTMNASSASAASQLQAAAGTPAARSPMYTATAAVTAVSSRAEHRAHA
jgi:hypothetical protein